MAILLWWHGQKRDVTQIDIVGMSKELQGITDVAGPDPGQHNWWRGDHVSVYDKGAREQIANLADIIDANSTLRQITLLLNHEYRHSSVMPSLF